MSCQGRDGPEASMAGASSIIACAFVPPTPKELTPARRGVPRALPFRKLGIDIEGAVCEIDLGIGLFKMQTRRQQLMLERQCSLDDAGNARRRARVADIGFHRADGAKDCFSASRREKLELERQFRSDLRATLPCHGLRCRSPHSGSTPAISSASAITCAWPSALGAVKPIFNAPSLLMADPLMTASMLSRSFTASAKRFRTTMPTPLPKTVPFARASKLLQCPSGETTPPSS